MWKGQREAHMLPRAPDTPGCRSVWSLHLLLRRFPGGGRLRWTVSAPVPSGTSYLLGIVELKLETVCSSVHVEFGLTLTPHLSSVLSQRGTMKLRGCWGLLGQGRRVFAPLKELSWWQEPSFPFTPQRLYPVVRDRS